MKYQAILFDMDGTLVPMETNEFVKGYFQLLFRKLAKYGLDPNQFGRNMWAGVSAMVGNDGAATNEERFWQVFCQLTGTDKDTINADCLEFYGNEFQQARQFTGENPLAAEAVRLAREKAGKVILATNPMFPMVGQQTRMSWVGLKPSDFDLVTSYEYERYCKPNPMYYTSICQRMGLDPAQCLMIGNDENEDMYAGIRAGLNCWLITDWMISSQDHPWNGPKGTFAQTVEMLKSLESYT
ncbi:MAG: HAD family hydrolase [Faecousia sp.]